MVKLQSVTLTIFRKFLKSQGLKKIGTNGGHEHWYKQGLLRKITLQTHVEPIPEFIIESNLKTLGYSKELFRSELARTNGKFKKIKDLKTVSEIIGKPPPPDIDFQI